MAKNGTSNTESLQPRTLTVLFLDIKGFSQIRLPIHHAAFFERVLRPVSKILDEEQPTLRNSWGDAIFAAFETPGGAAKAAARFRALFRSTNWQEAGLPAPLQARIALHMGPVLVGHDPVRGGLNALGSDVNFAARIEPICDPNEIWCTDAIEIQLKAGNLSLIDYEAIPLGARRLPKDFGVAELFCLREKHDKSPFPPGPNPFLQSFVEKEESDICSGRDSDISFKRAYRLLLHMFLRERIDEVAVLDMAFERWEELLNHDETQTVNLSIEIFSAIEDMARQKRCHSFRRILVIEPKRLKTRLAREVLARFLTHERACGRRAGAGTVKTRVLPYPKSETEIERLKRLADFAAFRHGDAKRLAIVETGQTSPIARHDARHATCRLVVEKARVDGMFGEFEALWKSALTLNMACKR